MDIIKKNKRDLELVAKSLFMFLIMFKNILYSKIYYLANFDILIQS